MSFLWRVLLGAAALALLSAPPARAYECEPVAPGAWSSEPCPYSEAVAFGGPAPGRVHAASDVSVAADGRVAVADGGANRAIVLAADGTPVLVLGAYAVGATAVAFAPDGSLYVAADGRIHRHAADGREIATITEGLTASEYVRVHDLAVDGDGRLYAAGSDGILVWSPQGLYERTIPRSADVIAAGGSGRLFAADAAAGRVEELTGTGLPVRTYTGHNAAFGTDGRLYVGRDDGFGVFDSTGARRETIARPEGFDAGFQLAAGPSALYAVSQVFSESDQVMAMSRTGKLLPPLGRESGKGLHAPAALAVEPGGRSFVADSRNRRLVELSAAGELVRVVRSYPAPAGLPVGVALGADGDLVVVTDAGVVERLGRDGAVRASWRAGDDLPAIHGVEVAPGGDVLVRDGATLLRFTPSGLAVRSFAVGPEGSGSGHGFAVGPDGAIYSAGESGIRKSSPTGALLATYPVGAPEGVALDAAGNLYVATRRGIKVLSPDGRPVLSWGADGTTAGRMQLPWDVDLDAEGRVYVADRGGHRVFRFTLRPPAAPVAPWHPHSTGPSGPAPRLTMRVLRSALATRRGEIRLRLSCSATCSGTAELRASGRRAGESRFRVRPGQALTVRVRLTKTARKRLAKKRRLRVAVLASVPGGTGARKALTLRLRRR